MTVEVTYYPRPGLIIIYNSGERGTYGGGGGGGGHMVRGFSTLVDVVVNH